MRPVPQRPVLVLQQDELAAGPLRAARLESWRSMSASRPEHLGLVRHERGQQLPQPDGLVAELAADERFSAGRRVPLVEGEVEDAEDRAKPLGEQVVRRYAERDAGLADLPLRAHEPLRERRLGTRNARAISAVVRPETMRSVSGMRRRREGWWQQAKISSRRSSGSGFPPRARRSPPGGRAAPSCARASGRAAAGRSRGFGPSP